MTAREELGSTSMKIYVYLLETGEPRSVREIARDLNIPASTVHYHLRKLEELGVVAKTGEGYVVKRAIPVEGFLVLGGKLVPRLLVYAAFFLGVTIGQVYTAVTSGLTPDKATSIATSTAATTILLVEGLNLRNKLKTR